MVLQDKRGTWLLHGTEQYWSVACRTHCTASTPGTPSTPSAGESWGVLSGTKEYCWVLRGTSGYWDVLQVTAGYHGVLRGSTCTVPPSSAQ